MREMLGRYHLSPGGGLEEVEWQVEERQNVWGLEGKKWKVRQLERRRQERRRQETRVRVMGVRDMGGRCQEGRRRELKLARRRKGNVTRWWVRGRLITVCQVTRLQWNGTEELFWGSDRGGEGESENVCAGIDSQETRQRLKQGRWRGGLLALPWEGRKHYRFVKGWICFSTRRKK